MSYRRKGCGRSHYHKSPVKTYIEQKSEEVRKFERTPHPTEFEMYYSV